MEDRYQHLLNKIAEVHKQDDIVETPNDNILVIDGTNTFIRVFSSMPTTNDDGIHVAGIVGFLRSIGAAIKMVKPTRVIVVFDGQGGSVRRKKLFPDYKKTRTNRTRPLNRHSTVNTSDEARAMLIQSIRCIEYLCTLPVTLLSIDNIEADDVMAYLTTNVFSDGKVTIMSTDKDFLQLVDDRVTVWSPTKKKFYTPESFFEEYEIHSKNFLLRRIIEGDKSDNIPGVMGVGFGTITKRLPFLLDDRKHTIDEILEMSAEKIDESVAYKKLVDGKETMNLNYDLMQLHEVVISGTLKLNILGACRDKIQTLNKSQFHQMFLEDRLTTVFADVNSWLTQVFYRLNDFANMHNGEDNEKNY